MKAETTGKLLFPTLSSSPSSWSSSISNPPPPQNDQIIPHQSPPSSPHNDSDPHLDSPHHSPSPHSSHSHSNTSNHQNSPNHSQSPNQPLHTLSSFSSIHNQRTLARDIPSPNSPPLIYTGVFSDSPSFFFPSPTPSPTTSPPASPPRYGPEPLHPPLPPPWPSPLLMMPKGGEIFSLNPPYG